MADHLFLSLKPPPPPPMIFPCFTRRPWCCRSSFSGEIRFSVRELLRLANSTSPSHSSSSSSPPSLDSAPAKFDVVSTTQLHDGSHVFRFGDASEIERNAEKEEPTSSVVQEEGSEIAEEASGVSAEQAVKEDSVHLPELEAPNGKSNSETETMSSNVKTVKEERAVPANRSDVIKIKDRKRPRSPSKKKKESSSPVSVSLHDDKVETEDANLSEMNSKEEKVTTICKTSHEKKVSISGDSETTNQSVAAAEAYIHPKVMENAVESEVVAKSSSSDCSETRDYPEIAEKHTESETTSELPTSEVFSENHEAEEVSEEKTGGIKQATAVVTPDEFIPTSGATHDGVDGTDEKSVTDQSDVATMRSDDVEIVVSTTKEERTLDAKKGDDVELFATDMTEPASIETASRREEIAPKEFYLDSGFTSLQKPCKALAGREDAYFISHQRWLGVADGVCQWSFEGINAGVYAQELLNNCQKIISDESVQITDPVEILGRSASETKSNGSSTALVAHFDGHELHVANVGDSGFMVIRDGTVLQKSSPMFHEFGFPLQLTRGDDPSKLAEVYRVNLDEGDVIVAATDGLFDNLYEREIVSMVSSSLQQNSEPQKIAELLAEKAQEVGSCASSRTPFADAARAAGYNRYRGGKPDAVTVIVSLVRTR
ncbi:PREDICTED: probable protein phosphatase 2C 62 isoform X2 [Tarenaya hassleriana]|uniref:probable protein phosphatase 2C 62 isoform X2 n=1 Tax=Tarenaya hassleriana TaxID=28532 RepID=UPI00053C41C7|nr:PREDICTED: probable protein phosphatase 2C 62 isoform X2 [Tarenaya hassleriana]